MKSCVIYFSLTGNTKRFAEAISELLGAPALDITSCDPSTVTDYDLLIIGTPVMGMQSAPLVSTFVKRLPQGYGKKTIIFCTYAIAKGGVLKRLERELGAKGYVTILSIGKKGVKQNKADFKDALAEVSRVVEEQTRN